MTQISKINGMSHVATILELNANDYVEIYGEADGSVGETFMLAGKSVFKIHKI